MKIKPRMKPEEEELQQKDALLRELESELLEKELALSILKQNLNVFEIKYMKVVGYKLFLIEELKSKLWGIISDYSDDGINSETDIGKKVNKTPIWDNLLENLYNQEESLKLIQEDIKILFRKVAKNIHPDLVLDENERTIREELMKKANDALSNNDVNTLLEILNEWENSPESIFGDDLGAELVRIIRKISQIKVRIQNIDDEVSKIENSDINKLYQRTQEVSYTGVDLVQKIADDVNKEINKILIHIQDVLTS